MELREGHQQFFWSWEPPACDSGPQPSITPSGRGLLPTSPARHPGIVTPPPLRFTADAGGVYRHPSFGSLDDELDHHDEDDDHDYIDDGESDNSDSI